MALTVCPKCANKGVIRVQYRSGEIFDLALCDCRQGLAARTFNDETIRGWFGGELTEENRIANVEDFDEDGERPSSRDVTNAGRPKREAKL